MTSLHQPKPTLTYSCWHCHNSDCWLDSFY